MRDHTFVWKGLLKSKQNKQSVEGNTHVGSKKQINEIIYPHEIIYPSQKKLLQWSDMRMYT